MTVVARSLTRCRSKHLNACIPRIGQNIAHYNFHQRVVALDHGETLNVSLMNE